MLTDCLDDLGTNAYYPYLDLNESTVESTNIHRHLIASTSSLGKVG